MRMREPWPEAKPGVTGAVKVSEVIMVPTAAPEQRIKERIAQHSIIGAIIPSRRAPQGAIEPHRGEEQAAIFERIIPVTIDEIISGGRPDITWRDPNPPQAIRRVEPGPPGERAASRRPVTGTI